jgi:hypothetical protein
MQSSPCRLFLLFSQDSSSLRRKTFVNDGPRLDLPGLLVLSFLEFLFCFAATPELWPFGNQSWYFGLTRHLEVLQHKIFALLLLSVGAVEFPARSRVAKGHMGGLNLFCSCDRWAVPALFSRSSGGNARPQPHGADAAHPIRAF